MKTILISDKNYNDLTYPKDSKIEEVLKAKNLYFGVAIRGLSNIPDTCIEVYEDGKLLEKIEIDLT